MHYHSVGEEITDQSQVGIVFYPKGYVPKHVDQHRARAERRRSRYSRPAPTTSAATRTTRWSKPARLVGFMPHMHNRGKRQCIEAIYPNMAIQQFNCVNYDFNWQIVYNYADDVAPLLPAGTIMHVISWHDNSAAKEQPGSAQLGRLRQPHHRRHGASLADLLLHDRRGIHRPNSPNAAAQKSMPRNQQTVAAERRLGSLHRTAASLVAAAAPTAQVRYATGQNVVPVFEGWERNADGTFNMVFGYMNRNYEEEIDLPVGPENTSNLARPIRASRRISIPAASNSSSRCACPRTGEEGSGLDPHLHGKTEKAYASLLPFWELGLFVYQENRGSTADITDTPEPNAAPTITMAGASTVTSPAGATLPLVVDVSDDGHPTPRKRPATATPAVRRDSDGAVITATGTPGPGGQGPRRENPLTQAVVRLEPGVALGVTWVVYRGDAAAVKFEPQRVGVVDGKAKTAVTVSKPGVFTLRAYADDGVLVTPLDVLLTVTR